MLTENQRALDRYPHTRWSIPLRHPRFDNQLSLFHIIFLKTPIMWREGQSFPPPHIEYTKLLAFFLCFPKTSQKNLAGHLLPPLPNSHSKHWWHSSMNKFYQAPISFIPQHSTNHRNTLHSLFTKSRPPTNKKILLKKLAETMNL